MVNKVITFYSYKGGVGRSMAMANIGVVLAQWGYKTLVIDWDLEAPGLEKYFQGYIDPDTITKKAGLIDLLNLRLNELSMDVSCINWEEYITPVPVNGNTHLHLITSGRRDENYVKNVRRFDFASFYNDCDGGQYLEDLRESWLNTYQFVLIDSRTGLTDSSGICSIHMPDVLVLLFTPNEQSFEGIKDVAHRAIEGQKKIIYDRFQLMTFPIPSRIENAETQLMDQWLKKIAHESEPMLYWLPRKQPDFIAYEITPGQLINCIKIPYKTFYSYGEKLAVIDRGTKDPQDLGYAYETIAAVLANNFQRIELLTDSRDTFLKKAKGEEISDHLKWQTKVLLEQGERKKLEEQLQQKVAKERIVNAQRKKNRVLAMATIASIAVGVIFYLVYLGREQSQAEIRRKKIEVFSRETLRYKNLSDSSLQANDTTKTDQYALEAAMQALNANDTANAITILKSTTRSIGDSTSNTKSEKELNNLLQEAYRKNLYKIDVFYIEPDRESVLEDKKYKLLTLRNKLGINSEQIANLIVKELNKKPNYVVRKRLLSAGIRKYRAYQNFGYEVRFNDDEERQIAREILTSINRIDKLKKYQIRFIPVSISNFSSPHYLSIFIKETQ